MGAAKKYLQTTPEFFTGTERVTHNRRCPGLLGYDVEQLAH